jgi:hypothetical protein
MSKQCRDKDRHAQSRSSPGFIKAGCKKIYHTLDELQADLDTWLKEYNESRSHSGKYCFGKTPMQTFLDSVTLAKEKMLNQTVQTTANVA